MFPDRFRKCILKIRLLYRYWNILNLEKISRPFLKMGGNLFYTILFNKLEFVTIFIKLVLTKEQLLQAMLTLLELSNTIS